LEQWNLTLYHLKIQEVWEVEKRRSTLSVLFYIKRQTLLKNGEAPVCMRITVDKRKAEIMIKRSVPVELWNQSKECSKGKDRSSQELNHYISSVRAKGIADTPGTGDR
jgi:hypothetical protein